MIKLHNNGEFSENTWIYTNEDTKEAIIIDPGTELEKLYKLINDYTINYIFITHSHFDHIQGLQELKKKYPSSIIVAHTEADKAIQDPAKNLSSIMGLDIIAPKADLTYNTEQTTIKAAGHTWTIIYTPGHTEDHTVFLSDDGALFAGDLIFAGGGIGRTDFPGANPDIMPSSIKKVLSLPEDTVVYSGHGDIFTIKEAKLDLKAFI